MTPWGVPLVNDDGAIIPDGEVTAAMWQAGQLTVSRLAEAVVSLVDEDIEAGEVPEDVESFGELHEYVDANEYLLQVVGMEPDSGESWNPFPLSEAVSAEVSEVLRKRSR